MPPSSISFSLPPSFPPSTQILSHKVDIRATYSFVQVGAPGTVRSGRGFKSHARRYSYLEVPETWSHLMGRMVRV